MDPIDRAPRGLRRRDFLALGTATLAAATWPRAGFAATSPLGLDLKSGSPLSVGYLAGSDEWVDQFDLPWEGPDPTGSPVPNWQIEVLPAEDLVVSSELSNRAIELTVHGLVPGVPARGRAAWRSAYFFASLPAPADMPFGPDPVPFLAWSARADGDPRQAAKVRPYLETGEDGSLVVGVEIHSGIPAGLPSGPRGPGGRARGEFASPRVASDTVLRTANFTVDSISGRPKLQQGVYLLALEAGLWRRPWSGPVSALALEPGLDSVAIAIRTLD